MILRRAPRTGGAELAVVSDGLKAFDGLKTELDQELPDGGWVDVRPADLFAALPAAAPPAALIAAGSDAPEKLEQTEALVRGARQAGSYVILLVQELSPASMHRLMRAGADDFLPVPIPEGGISEALDRMRDHGRGGAAAPAEMRSRNGALLAVYGVSGGVGATTYAVNLAWELAQESRKANLRVLLLDLDFQYGSVSTYLDLARGDAVYELLTSVERLDAAGLRAALSSFKRRMDVLTAPADALPFDIIDPEGLGKLLELGRATHDVVVVDMPRTLTEWTETVLQQCQSFHALMEMDLRSAQNMLRFLRALKAEDLPLEKVEFILNRAPGFSDFGARGRVKKMAQSLGIEYAANLPDGGKVVTQACDHGAPLAEYAGSNPLRKEVRKAAKAILDQLEKAKAASA
ncbi:MAG: AAA family ATPase [Pseudomonadota bacterium]